MVPETTHGDKRELDIRRSYIRRYIPSVTVFHVCVSIIVTCIMFLYVSVSLSIDTYVCHLVSQSILFCSSVCLCQIIHVSTIVQNYSPNYRMC